MLHAKSWSPATQNSLWDNYNSEWYSFCVCACRAKCPPIITEYVQSCHYTFIMIKSGLKADLQYDARPAYRQFLIKSVGDLTF